MSRSSAPNAVVVDYAALGSSDIIVELKGAVAIITLNQSARCEETDELIDRVLFRLTLGLHVCRRNVFTQRLASELITVFETVDRDDRARVVVLTADHKAPAFCAGVRIFRFSMRLKGGILLITPQADIGNGWNDLWDPEAEKEPDPVRGELSAIVVT